MNTQQNLADLAGRVLISAIFLVAGLNKVTGYAGTQAYMESMVGKQQRVLVERVDHKGVARGYGEHYLPVHFQTTNRTRNRFEEILLTRVLPGGTPVITGSIVQVPQ